MDGQTDGRNDHPQYGDQTGSVTSRETLDNDELLILASARCRSGGLKTDFKNLVA